MRLRLTFVITSWACAGCSLLYNPNNLPGASDAQIDAEIIDPTKLEIDRVTPSQIYEGQGEFGSRPAIVVIHGNNIIDRNTVVEITPVSRAAQLAFGTPVIASNGHWIAVPVTARVDPGLEPGVTVALDVKVTQELPLELGGGTPVAMLHDQLTLVGLPELTSRSPELANGRIRIDGLADRYSKVDLSNVASAAFVGSTRAIVRSMSSITALALTANGPPGADGGGGGVAIAGGCDGGGPGGQGGCGTLIGGKGGAADSLLTSRAGGGGGGGFATGGMAGTGTVAGGGGESTGDALIVTYGGAGSSQNRAGGGGGGGNPMLGGTGGGGGAGGGSIELTAGGDLSVSSITADGGRGGDGNNGGGGGGGAGGLVMLRADGSLAASGPISVTGGEGGVGPGSNGEGGRGSHGRVRWDALTGTPPTVPNGTRHRGPSFQLDAQVVRTSTPSITVIGTTDDRFDVYWDNDNNRYTAATSSIGSAGATITPTLREGLNHLCITLVGGKQGESEAEKCVDIAFLP